MLVLSVATALLQKETHDPPRHSLRVLHHAKAHDEPAHVLHHAKGHERVLHHAKAREESVRILHHAKAHEHARLQEDEEDACICVPLERSAEEITAKGVPESYGAECGAHDLSLDLCDGEFKA